MLRERAEDCFSLFSLNRVSNDEMFNLLLPATHGCSFQTSLQHLRQLIGVPHRVLRAVVGRRADPGIARCHPLPRLRRGDQGAALPLPHHGDADEFVHAGRRLLAVQVNCEICGRRILRKLTFFEFLRWLFVTGRLNPEQDYFRCVVNIPDDHRRVDEPSEVDGEQVSVDIN